MTHHALTTAQIAIALQATISALQTEIAALPDAVIRFRPAPGEWCVNEVIGHLIETEQRGFSGRISQMLVQADYVCQAWDQDQVARDRHDDEKSAVALLDELAAKRAESIVMVQTLTPDQLTCTAEHPVVGQLSVNNLLHEWVHHDRNHINQIMSNFQLWFWPAMGNTQRFTTG